MVVTRTYRDSEMVVWFASGLSLTRWIAPVLTFGLPLVLLTGRPEFCRHAVGQAEKLGIRGAL
jgi:lipopolysaccharide export system permease protein